MKLVIINHCVVSGGKIAEAGQVYDTKIDDPKSDLEAFTLISSGRALQASTDEAKAFLTNFAASDDSAPAKKGK